MLARQDARVTLTYFLVLIAIGMSGGLLGPALPHLAEMTDSSMGHIAVLFTARALGNMLGSVVSGLLIDRFSGHRVLIIMLVLMALGLAVVPYSQTLVVLTAVIFVLGFAEVSLNAGSNTLLLWTHGSASTPWISALHFCFGFGNMVVPLVLIAVLAVTGKFAWAFWLVALFGLLLLWPLARQASPRALVEKNHDKPVKAVPDPGLLAIFMLMFGLYVGMEITFAGWATSYGTLSGMSSQDAAMLVTLFWLTLSAGRLLAIPLLRLFSPWHVLIGCLGLGLVTALSLHAAWLPLPLMALLFGLSASAIFPTLFGLSNQLITMSGRTTGLIFLSAGTGALAVPSLTGPLLEWAGTRAFPLLLAALMATLMLGLALLHARVKRMEG